jgi:D-alanine-D-alanine ligase
LKTNTEVLKKDKKANGLKSLGPVKELEAHVHPEWWRYIFNALYIKTDGDVVEDDAITKNEVDIFLNLLNIEANAKILDVCCGQGRHSFEFYRRGLQNIEGIDRSSYLISKARARNRENQFAVKFREGDARKLPYRENSFDVVMILGNSFGYFESFDDDVQVLRSAFKILKPGGKLLIDIADGNFLKNNFKPRSWEWINHNYFVCRERCISSNGKKLISREVITQTNKGVIADQFYAENLYNKEAIENLVKTAGFKNIEVTSGYEVKSQRNQDLGMMENRLILIANS